MSRYNNYLVSGFSGCRCLAHAYDQHRSRNVRIFQMPGYLDVVGVTDGVDSWIAPVVAEIFSINIQRLLQDLAAGSQIKLPVMAPGLSEQAPEKRARRVLLTPTEGEGQGRGRKPLLVDPGQPQTLPRRTRTPLRS